MEDGDGVGESVPRDRSKGDTGAGSESLGMAAKVGTMGVGSSGSS